MAKNLSSRKLPLGIEPSITLVGHSQTVGRIAWAPDGSILASASGDKTIRLWDIKTGELLQVITGHEEGVWAIEYHPSGDIIASGSHDKTVRIWDAKSGDIINVLRHKSSATCGIQF